MWPLCGGVVEAERGALWSLLMFMNERESRGGNGEDDGKEGDLGAERSCGNEASVAMELDVGVCALCRQ